MIICLAWILDVPGQMHMLTLWSAYYLLGGKLGNLLNKLLKEMSTMSL